MTDQPALPMPDKRPTWECDCARPGAWAALSVVPDTVPARKATASALRANGREVDAQVVNVLNDLQALNERARVALLNGNNAALTSIAVAMIDNGHTLLTLTAP